ncbi:MAG: 2-hydroxymuconate tautomerase [Peptococcaceae bacterium]
MPVVQIEMIEGRTLEQKRALVEKVTAAISETVNCSKDSVTIIIREMPTQHIAKGGKLSCDQ